MTTVHQVWALATQLPEWSVTGQKRCYAPSLLHSHGAGERGKSLFMGAVYYISPTPHSQKLFFFLKIKGLTLLPAAFQLLRLSLLES